MGNEALCFPANLFIRTTPGCYRVRWDPKQEDGTGGGAGAAVPATTAQSRRQKLHPASP